VIKDKNQFLPCPWHHVATMGTLPTHMSDRQSCQHGQHERGRAVEPVGNSPMPAEVIDPRHFANTGSAHDIIPAVFRSLHEGTRRQEPGEANTLISVIGTVAWTQFSATMIWRASPGEEPNVTTLRHPQEIPRIYRHNNNITFTGPGP
jgi:hypothetical protein